MKFSEAQRNELFHALREPELPEAASVDAIGTLDEIVIRDIDNIEPIITQWLADAVPKIVSDEQRLGECLLLLCCRNPTAASIIMQELDRGELSNGAHIIKERLDALHKTYQHGLPILKETLTK